jgi:hypothetical protein
MSLNPPTISKADQELLSSAYRTLLENRERMIDALQPDKRIQYFEGIFVDSIILGVMAHFHEVARNQSVFAAEITGWGGTFANYLNDRASQVGVLLPHSSGNPPTTQRQPSQGRRPGRR